MNQYFLVASLPTLQPGERPAISPDAFLERAADQVSVSELETLRQCVEGQPKAAGGLGKEWQDVERTLRNLCVRHRAAKLGVDVRMYLREPEGHDAMLEAGVAAAFSAPHPQERERALEQLRWAALERMAGYDPFTFRALQAYAMRLGMAWRWAEMNSEQGTAAAAKLAGLSMEQSAGALHHD